MAEPRESKNRQMFLQYSRPASVFFHPPRVEIPGKSGIQKLAELYGEAARVVVRLSAKAGFVSPCPRARSLANRSARPSSVSQGPSATTSRLEIEGIEEIQVSIHGASQLSFGHAAYSNEGARFAGIRNHRQLFWGHGLAVKPAQPSSDVHFLLCGKMAVGFSQARLGVPMKRSQPLPCADRCFHVPPVLWMTGIHRDQAADPRLQDGIDLLCCWVSWCLVSGRRRTLRDRPRRASTAQSGLAKPSSCAAPSSK